MSQQSKRAPTHRPCARAIATLAILAVVGALVAATLLGVYVGGGFEQ